MAQTSTPFDASASIFPLLSPIISIMSPLDSCASPAFSATSDASYFIGTRCRQHLGEEKEDTRLFAVEVHYGHGQLSITLLLSCGRRWAIQQIFTSSLMERPYTDRHGLPGIRAVRPGFEKRSRVSPASSLTTHTLNTHPPTHNSGASQLHRKAYINGEQSRTDVPVMH